jgi:hypothetical protein
VPRRRLPRGARCRAAPPASRHTPSPPPSLQHPQTRPAAAAVTTAAAAQPAATRTSQAQRRQQISLLLPPLRGPHTAAAGAGCRCRRHPKQRRRQSRHAASPARAASRSLQMVKKMCHQRLLLQGRHMARGQARLRARARRWQLEAAGGGRRCRASDDEASYCTGPVADCSQR